MTSPAAAPTERRELVDRVRATLAGERSTREVAMFGGRSFLVHDKMVVSVRPDGLLVRVDPGRRRELVALPGAAPAEMPGGRTMGPSWLVVAEDAVATDERLSFWIAAALDVNQRSGADTEGAAVG